MLQPIVGFLGVPLLLRHVIVPAIERRLNGRVTLAAAQFNPYTWRLGLDELSMLDPDGHETIACRRAEIDFNPLSSLVLPGWRFNEIILTEPSVDLINALGEGLNLSRMLAGTSLEKPPAPDVADESFRMPRLIIGAFEIRDGDARLEDRTFAQPVVSRLDGVTFRVEHLDTTPDPLVGEGSMHSMVATTESGATIRWTGTLSLDPLESKGVIVVNDASLPNIGAYATRLTDVQIQAGTLSALLSYHIAPIPKAAPHDPNSTLPAPAPLPPIVRATLAHTTIQGLVTSRDGTPLANVPEVLIRGADIDAIARTAVIALIDIDRGDLVVERDESGVFNLARMLRERPAAPSATTNSQQTDVQRPRVDVTRLVDPAQQLLTSVSYLLEDLTGAWTISVEELSIARQSITIDDRLPVGYGAKPVHAELRDTFLLAGPIRTADGFVIPFDATTALNGTDLSAEGLFAVDARTLDARIQTNNLELLPFAPYLRLVPIEPFDQMDLSNGTLTVGAQMRLATPDASRIQGSWDGEFLLRDVAGTAPSGALVNVGLVMAEGTAALDLSRAEGIVGTCTGTLDIREGAAGPALLSSWGLGEGHARLAEAHVKGEATFARPHESDTRLVWDGTVDLTTFAAEHLLAGGASGAELAVDATRATSTLNAHLTLVRHGERAGGIDGRWKGSIALDSAKVHATGADPLRLQTSTCALDGEGTIGLTNEHVVTLGWTGAATLGSLEANVGQDEQALRIVGQDANVRGEWMMARSQKDPAKAAWRGTAQLGEASLERGGINALVLTQTAGRFDGALEAHLKAGGGAEVHLDAECSITGAKAQTPSDGGGPGLVLRSDLLRFLGRANGQISGDPDAPTISLGWSAMAETSDTAVARSDRPGEPFAESESMFTRGEGDASMDATGQRVHWQGVATATATSHLWQAADGSEVVARLGQGTLDGMLSLERQYAPVNAPVERGAEQLRGHWTGRATLTIVNGDVSHPASEPLHAEVGSITGTSELTLEADEQAISLVGKVEGEATGASGSFGDESIASIAQAALGGDLRLRRRMENAHEPVSHLVEWKGQLAAQGFRGSHGSGASRLNASGDELRIEGAVDIGSAATTGVEGSAQLAGLTASRGEDAIATGKVRLIDLSRFRFDEGASLLTAERLAIDGVTIDAPVKDPRSQKDADHASVDQRATASSKPEPLQGRISFLGHPLTVRLGQFALTDGSVRLSGTPDGSADGTPTTVTLDQLELLVDDLSTDGTHVRADAPTGGGAVTMTGRVVGSGRLALSGTIDPFQQPPMADVVLTLETMPLPPVDPLASRYVGYQLAAGRLSTRIPATIDGGTMRGTLDFTLDAVELGERSKHPDAPSLPLGFALAILRDANGQVRGSIPFSGDVTDPDFSLRGLIFDVIIGFIGKVATAPFQLLASAFAGGEEIDLSHIPFEPGSDRLGSDALHRVDLLTRALQERPSLSLSVIGQVHAETDGEAIRRMLLRALALKRAQNTARPTQTLDEASYRWLVGVLYRETASEEDAAAAEAPEEPSFESMERAMLARVGFTETMLDDLAQRRAEAVVAAFVGAGVASGRVAYSYATAETREQESPRASIGLEGGSNVAAPTGEGAAP
ncbi:MAG: DUF748 domain-containing protein [Phycisphaerae bacterium]|nr:DUF748 domain-containing protein [Phycisphaerae bacterium]